MSTHNVGLVMKSIIDEYTSGDKQRIPGIVYCAVGKDGVPIFQHASGKKGLSSNLPMTLDTTFWLVSFTKLITSIACMQCVERGLLLLDDAEHLETLAPELRDVKVLQRTPEDGFEYVEKEGRITLRMLLNHTAGFGYAFEDSKLAEVSRPVGLDDFSCDRLDTINRPLVNQPGTTFQYGTSMDWVGIIIERVSGHSLESYFQSYILGPLNITSISFRPSDEAKSGLAHMHQRDLNDNVYEIDHIYKKPLMAKNDEEREQIYCAGGHGCFGKPADYARIIALLLNDGTDAKTGAQLLKTSTVEEMFRDQIVDKPRFSNEFVPVSKPNLARPTPLSPMPENHTEGWGLSFSLSHWQSPTGRASGSGSWEGLANLYWFADRKNKLGGLIATQIAPFGEG
nr:beta-lactamase family protein [Colletotrichum truncatum]KAF6780681.1 beta-lactamase family protein [Colletotrichum truncatum]